MNKIIEQTNGKRWMICQERGAERERPEEMGFLPSIGLKVILTSEKQQQISTQRLSFFFLRVKEWAFAGNEECQDENYRKTAKANKVNALLLSVLLNKALSALPRPRVSLILIQTAVSPAVTHSFHWWKPWQKTRCVGLGFVFFVFVFYCSRSSLCTLLSTQHYRE